MLIDAIAERYGCLPSHVLKEGDTFDLMVMDVALTYRAYEAEIKTGKPVSKELQKRMFDSDAELAEHFYRVRGRQNDNQN